MIGRLSDVSPRDAWRHEAHEFTPWLAENLDQLGDALGLQLDAEGVEVAVGAFSADIIARDSLDRLVLIENQLEPTNHTHLGQVLTYLSGLDAEIVIWIATEFREPHLSAINWLNEHTADQFAFFAVRLRVVRIGDSPPAPVFDVLARPNQWDREMQQVLKARTSEASELTIARRDFWDHYLKRYPSDAELGLLPGGTSAKWLSPPQSLWFLVSLYKARGKVGVFLRGPRGTQPAEVQRRLEPHAQRFEELAGGCQHLGVDSHHPADEMRIDSEDPANWDQATEWLHDRAHAFLDAAITIFGESEAR